MGGGIISKGNTPGSTFGKQGCYQFFDPRNAHKVPNGRRCRRLWIGKVAKRVTFPFSCFFSSKYATTTAEKKEVGQRLHFHHFIALYISCLYIFYSVVKLLGFVLWVLLLIRSLEPTQLRFIHYWFS